MSHAVVAGSATAAQRYVDGILRQVGRVDSLPAVLYHCMREHPEDVFMINALSGESFNNASLLVLSTAGARALAVRGGRRACVLATNHENLVAAQLACLFAGVVPLGLDPKQTSFEFEHFFKLWSPDVIFCDVACRAAVQQAVDSSCRDDTPIVVTLDDGGYGRFISGYSQGTDDFQVAPPAADGVMMVLPTSGSTGQPKASLISHRGMVAQLPTIWAYDTKFPSPVSRLGVLSTAQWLTWYCVVLMAPVFRITLVMTPQAVTPQTTLDMYHKYKVEWGMISPALASKLVGPARREHFSSLHRVLVAGSSIAVATVAALQDLLQPGAFVRPGYGMTELEGFSFLPDESTPLESIGRPINIFQYKIADDIGQELGLNKKGELWMKSEICLFKGYYQNAEATRESLSDDGWLRTGDIFYKDERDNYCFCDRKKFGFKVNNYQVSPEEVEAVVGSVRGVEMVCVSGVRGGAAAAALVTCRQDEPPPSRDDIHRAVSKLNEYKHLNGGIAFVESLPLTMSGKVKRKECQLILERLIEENKCFK